MPPTKPNYGIDAPGVIRNLFLGCLLCLLAAFLAPNVDVGRVHLEFFPGMLYSAASFGLAALLMLVYGKRGKFRHRDRMLDKVEWTGEETVLDVGTGLGLMLIGAAKRLKSGHGVGIDIWNRKDLSRNGADNLLDNIRFAGVHNQATMKCEDARSLSFGNASFDVVLSNLCLHNIAKQSGRQKACREIARVLKPGGVAVISDYKRMREYAAEFERAGLDVEMCGTEWLTTFPPLQILVARKPG